MVRPKRISSFEHWALTEISFVTQIYSTTLSRFLAHTSQIPYDVNSFRYIPEETKAWHDGRA